ncbi:MAG: aminoglycoside phosphotransferase family protein [Myxococcaceae bacterium]|nr:aminoglycoside phosphotransferase family protein [Myxococcaceae bacterium]
MRAPLSDGELNSRLSALGLTRDLTVRAPPPSKNRTVVCRRGRQRVLVKVADGAGNVGVLREGSVLERITPLAGRSGSPLLIAPVVAFEPASGLLALAWLSSSETLHHFHRRTGEYPKSVARQVGAGLGYLHQQSRESPAGYALADAFRDESDLLECFLRMRPEFYARLSSAGLGFFASVQANRGAMEGLQALASAQASAHDATLLHGDMRQANLVRVGKAKVPPVVFLDWEQSFWGDPSRDLGSLLADYVGAWLAPEHKSEVLSHTELSQFARALLESYAEARGPSFSLSQAFQQRVVRWVGAALLIALYGITHYEQVLDERGKGLARQALDMLADPSRWVSVMWGEA